MSKVRREITRKLRILQHAEETGDVSKTCRYFGVGRSSFYRWQTAYRKHGDAGLVNRPPIPKWHANRTPVEIEEKVLHLRSKHHLGPMRIVWYLARYHGIKISDATVSRMLKRNGVNRLPRGTRLRKVHMGRPGGWTGEGCFLTRRPRRLGLHCILDTWLFHVPLNVLDEMAAKDPNVIRYISQILLLNSDMLVHVVHDLQIPQAERRIAAILWRTAFHGNQAVPLSQEEIGAMSNTSRKQVNAALRKFAELGWLTASYRQVTVENAAALNAFAKEED
ncbi:helix-turn-helix domain-containing protein [Aquamicrobium sp. cd-1]|uniref:Helix-turn-helix domain-containing protein n=1 Tax=Aquamicrobium zhengzhouense TaxID=2781738 RepID=A0ABS0SGV6_9HYPH|nr:helix-turn-helix domain-containing protein [Aquamicrobium zhengzhouense]